MPAATITTPWPTSARPSYLTVTDVTGAVVESTPIPYAVHRTDIPQLGR